MAATKSVTVLGGGVSGLTTAFYLAEKGYQVTIITKELAQNTVSGVAAAIWFPYEARPVVKVNSWSKTSYYKFLELSKVKDSGVSLIPFTIVELEDEEPFWLSSLPDDVDIKKEAKNIGDKKSIAYTMPFPLVETPIYLRYLQNEFARLGGKVIQKTISDLSELDMDRTIINCLGLDAKELFGDSELYPIQGQVLKLAPSSSIHGLSIEFPLDEYLDELVYMIPRTDCIVIGGSAKANVSSTSPDEKLTQRILNRATKLVPELKNLELMLSVVGLRPGRSSVRLEQDPNLPIIHNYGHGGAGYTVSWGCAENVYELMSDLG